MRSTNRIEACLHRPWARSNAKRAIQLPSPQRAPFSCSDSAVWRGAAPCRAWVLLFGRRGIPHIPAGFEQLYVRIITPAFKMRPLHGAHSAAAASSTTTAATRGKIGWGTSPKPMKAPGPGAKEPGFYWKRGNQGLWLRGEGDGSRSGAEFLGSWGNRVPLWCVSPRSPSSRHRAQSITGCCFRKGSAWFWLGRSQADTPWSFQWLERTRWVLAVFWFA